MDFGEKAGVFEDFYLCLSVLHRFKIFAACADFISAYAAWSNCWVSARRAASSAAIVAVPFSVTK